RWIDYTGMDVIVTSLTKLESLAKLYPIQHAAIRDWLRSGGTLVVYDVHRNWSDLSEVESLAGLAEEQRKAESISDPIERGWKSPRRKVVSRSPATSAAGIPSRQPDGSIILPANPVQPPPEDDKEAEGDSVPIQSAPFITRKCGLGLIAAVRSNEKSEGQSGDFLSSMLSSAIDYAFGGRSSSTAEPSLFNSIGSNRWNWRERWGVSLYQQNSDFWDLLIPGVGLVPVVQFQVLITLFVIAIGPVNYYLLKRSGKL